MIGIDIGRVIISGDTDIENQFFTEQYLEVPAVENAFQSIGSIVEKYKAENVHLVSKCSEKTQVKTLNWLENKDFFHQTNFLRSNLWFCRDRKDKKEICEGNQIKKFIDDRFSVLVHLLELEELYLFNPSAEELKKFNDSVKKANIQVVNTWEEILENI